MDLTLAIFKTDKNKSETNNLNNLKLKAWPNETLRLLSVGLTEEDNDPRLSNTKGTTPSEAEIKMYFCWNLDFKVSY